MPDDHGGRQSGDPQCREAPAMTVPSYPELFNDVFGPVMQPGSSSHTAAPCRLGRLAADLLGEPLADVQVVLDRNGSFSGTFGIMAEDRAMVAGALGMLPDDERLFRSFELAEEADVGVGFDFGELTESCHPNAMKFVLTGRSGRRVTLVGVSTGGGMIETVLVDGFPLRLEGDAFVLLAFGDAAAGAESGVAELLASGAARLPGFVGAEAVRGQSGTLRVASFCVEQDAATLRGRLVERRPDVRVAVLRPVLPVLSTAARRPQLFDTMTSWRQIAARDGRPLWEVAVQYEMDASGWTRERVIDFMRELARVMHRQTRAAYDEGVTVPTSPFKPDFTTGWAAHQDSGRRLSGDLVAQTIRWAYGAGAGIPGVKTVPGPMGGGGGYIYAALSAVRDCRDFTDDDLLRGLFVAGGIGAIAFTRTEPTGEVLGCGGEGGICGAMAAAAIAEMAGGTPEQVENAASLSLQAAIGLPCDPIPGGGCQPCRSRLLAVATTAHVFADLALAGHHAVLPLHEAIDVLDAVGRSLPPELLCTSRGGACATPTAERRAAAYRHWYGATRPEDRPPGNLI
jgi:L-serine dehydratase